jgi:6-phosphogluconolactonase
MPKRHVFRFSYSCLITAIAVCGISRGDESEPTDASSSNMIDETFVYVGTYTDESSKGIYLFKLSGIGDGSPEKATLVPLGLAAEVASPSFLDADPKRRLLFAVTESSEFAGKPAGAVSAFSIEPDSGKLTLINQQSSEGAGPCHLVLDKAGKNVLVANYGSGSVAVLPVGDDGRLGKATSVIQHQGKSVNPQRQEGPHAHCVTLDPANRFAFVCDLGLDKILIYRFDSESGELTPNEPAFAAVAPGAGPRHMVFRPDGRFAYVINELDSTITAFAYDPETGALAELQTIATLPAGFGDNTTAEIEIHPSGNFLYGSNRGHDSVVAFAVDPQSGKLTHIDHQSTAGRTPRNFAIDPSGQFLAVGNQDSDTILLCRIDTTTGRLQPTGDVVEAPKPVCIKFVPAAALGH